MSGQTKKALTSRRFKLTLLTPFMHFHDQAAERRYHDGTRSLFDNAIPAMRPGLEAFFEDAAASGELKLIEYTEDLPMISEGRHAKGACRCSMLLSTERLPGAAMMEIAFEILPDAKALVRLKARLEGIIDYGLGGTGAAG